jgi:chemotaxis protein histidine kinase CheA
VDQIKQQLDTLSELSDEQVTELQSAIVNEFETVETEDPTPQTVDAMTSLADMLDTVRGEVKRREAAAEELTARAAEAATRVKGMDEEDAMDGESQEEGAMKTPVETAAPEAEKTDKAASAAEASTAVDEASELSTTEDNTAVESEPAAEAGNAPMPEEVPAPATEEEAPVEEAAPAEEEEAMSEAAEAAVDVEAGAEASSEIQETALVEEQKEQEAVTAAAADETFEAPVDRRPAARTAVAPVAITAGADIPGYTAGSSVDSMSEVADLMSKRLHGLRRVNGGDGEQHIVASISTTFPEERTLTQDAESNWAKIQQIVSPEAITASGGHVAPFESRYDIFGLGTTSRPVRDSLARFQADRGGIRFVTPPVLSSYANAVGVWTAANDAATTPNPSAKLSLTVAAAAEQSVSTDAVTLQLQFGNLVTRAYPELIARHNELGLIQHAREAEQNLLTKIGDASTAVTTTSLIGFGRDFLVQMGRAAAAYRSRHRMEADAPLRAIVPSWVKDAMAADLALAMPGDSTLNAYSEIDGYVAGRNINLTVALDQNVFGAQGTGALNEFANSFTWYLFAEGSFLFLDGGTLDLGIIRDSTLVGTNDYKMFVETFENIAFVGVESLKVTSTISVNGAAAALRDTTGGATAAAIEY